MPRKMTKKAKKTVRKHRGGGYGFGGSIFGDNANAAGAGNAQWNNTGGECGVQRAGNDDLPTLGPKVGGRRRSRSRRNRRSSKRGGAADPLADVAKNGGAGSSGDVDTLNGRGGNQIQGGRRRRRSSKRDGKRGRRTMKGGSTLAFQQPPTSYTFTGAGAGGIADAVPEPPYTTYV